MVKKICPATAARMDGPEPDTCHCTLPQNHNGLHLCEHGFQFGDEERNDLLRIVAPEEDPSWRRGKEGVPIPGVKIIGEIRPHRGKT